MAGIDDMFTQEFWDARYSSADQVWSGNPNPQLVDHAAALTPGDALDVGSGEGADALWLAARGWQVTGVDLSEVALAKAAAQAERAGLADRTTWQRVDAFTWEPGPARYDLVSAQFMHLPRPVLRRLHARLAAVVRPGGRLLVVGHHPLDPSAPQDPDHQAMLFLPAQVTDVLPAPDWDVVVADAPEREATGPDGQLTRRDSVVLAVRRQR